MQLITPDALSVKVCGACGRPVGYLDLGGRIRRVDGHAVRAEQMILVRVHECPPGTGIGDAGDRPSGVLPHWCLEHILIALEGAYASGLTADEINAKVFDPPLPKRDLLGALLELRRGGEVVAEASPDVPTGARAGLWWRALTPDALRGGERGFE